MKNWQPLLTLVLLVLPMAAHTPVEPDTGEGFSCQVRQLQVERLPSLNVPRSGHNAFWLNGELTVFGGHTTGFVPTPTAEYYADGQWHTMQMTYSHDDGLALPLTSGKVLLAGGHSEPLGIGQTFSVELYNPDTHTFDGFGCLDTKRSLMGAVEMDSGQVLISGNWYHDDAIECFDGKKRFAIVKEVITPRSNPYMLHVAPDDAIIFSPLDTRGNRHDSIMADRLKGASFHIPLFDDWKPVINNISSMETNFQIDDYTYLLTATDTTGQMGIVRMRGTTFSLLSTLSPIPMTDQGDTIYYGMPLVDRKRQQLQVIGSNYKGRIYVLSIDYTRQPAPLTLYRSNPMSAGISYCVPVLSPDGDIIITGGITLDNFHPFGTVYRLSLTTDSVEAASIWSRVFISGALLVMAVLIAYLIRRRRQKNAPATPADSIQQEDSQADTSGQKALMQRICQLVEQQQLYLNSELKVADIADAFQMHRNDISACINSQMGCTFAQYINRYRISHAQKLMLSQPDKKISALWLESGFGSEQTFFKTFRSVTGLSPKEWILQAKDPMQNGHRG